MPHNVALWLPPSPVAASWPKVDQCETSANVVAEAEAALMGTGYTANTLQAFKTLLSNPYPRGQCGRAGQVSQVGRATRDGT